MELRLSKPKPDSVIDSVAGGTGVSTEPAIPAVPVVPAVSVADWTGIPVVLAADWTGVQTIPAADGTSPPAVPAVEDFIIESLSEEGTNATDTLQNYTDLADPVPSTSAKNVVTTGELAKPIQNQKEESTLRDKIVEALSSNDPTEPTKKKKKEGKGKKEKINH